MSGGIVLSSDGEAGFEVAPVETINRAEVHCHNGYGRVSAIRKGDGRVYVSMMGKVRSTQFWRTFGAKVIDSHFPLPAKPRSFVKALEDQPQWELENRGFLSMSFMFGPITANTEGAVEVSQSERVSRARTWVERETKAYDEAASKNRRAHELLEPMLAAIEEALATPQQPDTPSFKGKE